MTTASMIDIPKCDQCQDTGFILKGKLAVPCECQKRIGRLARTKELLTECGLRGALLEKTFDNYKPRNESQTEALGRVKRGGCFFLIGDWGVGKTHLLAASVNEAIKSGVAALFYSVPWLLQKIRDDLLSNLPIGVLERVCEVEYLALDDLGKEKPTESVQEKLFMLIDRREIEGLRTCVTSNFTPETIEKKLDGAIMDRLMGMCDVVLIKGASHRREG